MDFRALDAYLNTLPDLDFPMADVIVMHDHEVVYRRMVGHSDYARQKPIDGSERYWFFSASKPITCTAAMQLVCDGRLGLDEPLAKYIPEFAEMTVVRRGETKRAENPILIRHLFSMTAGFGYDLNTPHFAAARKADPHADTLTLVRALAADPIGFEPGTHFCYSLCHDVLAAVIEVVSGERFADYVRDHIFVPLGMTSCGFHPSEEELAHFADMYQYDTPFCRSRAVPCENMYRLTDRYDSGGAGVYGTVADYIRFSDALACGGVGANGARILPEAGVCMMQENQLCEAALRDFRGSPRKYGYGWGLCGRVHMSPLQSHAETPVGEFGWDGAAAAYTLIDPENCFSLFFGAHIMSCSYAYERAHLVIRDLAELGLRA